MSRTGILLLSFLVVVAIATSWLKTKTTDNLNQLEEKTHAADFFMDDFHALEFDNAGKTVLSLKGRRIEHFAVDDKSIIEDPEIIMHPETSNKHWQVTAKQAVTETEKMDEIIFRENVLFLRPGSENVEALTLKTEHLLIQPHLEQLSTKGMVTITGNTSSFTGQNMEANLKLGQFQLFQAKGRYAP